MGAEVLGRQVGLEGVADLPLLVGGGGLRLGLGHLDGGVAGAVEPLVELGEEVRGVGRGVEGCVFEGVVDEDVLPEEGLGEGGHLPLVHLAVPLLEDVDEEPELVLLREERVFAELLQLEGRVLLPLEQLSQALLHRLPRVVHQDVLQGCAARGLFHIEIGYSSKSARNTAR